MARRANSARRRRWRAVALAVALVVGSTACSNSSTSTPVDATLDADREAGSPADGSGLDAATGDDSGRDATTDRGRDGDGNRVGCGSFPWGIAFGEDGRETVHSLGLDGDGNLYFVGNLASAEFGGMRFAPDLATAYVASLAPDCSVRWVRLLAPKGRFGAWDIAVATSGESFVLAHYRSSGTVEVGGHSLETDDIAGDLYVVKLDRDGSVEWLRRLGADRLGGISLLPEGDVAVSGSFSGTADFGDTELSSGDRWDAFVARLRPSGSVRWVRQLAGVDRAQAHDVASDSEGNLYVVGEMADAVDLGERLLDPPGGAAAFVVSLGPDGTHRWSEALAGSVGSDMLTNVSVGAGRVGVAGWHEDTLYFAQRTTDGAAVWSRSASGRRVIKGTVIDSGGRFWVWVGAPIAFGDEWGIGSRATVLAVLDADGGLLAAVTASGADDDIWQRSGIALDDSETRGYVAGGFTGEVTFESVSLTGNVADGFVAGFEPDAVLGP